MGACSALWPAALLVVVIHHLVNLFWRDGSQHCQAAGMLDTAIVPGVNRLGIACMQTCVCTFVRTLLPASQDAGDCLVLCAMAQPCKISGITIDLSRQNFSLLTQGHEPHQCGVVLCWVIVPHSPQHRAARATDTMAAAVCYIMCCCGDSSCAGGCARHNNMSNIHRWFVCDSF